MTTVVENVEIVLDSIIGSTQFNKCNRQFIVKCVLSGLGDVIEKLLCPKDPSVYKLDDCDDLKLDLKGDLLAKICKLLILANRSENVCKVLTNFGLVFNDCIKNEFIEETCKAIAILNPIPKCFSKFGTEVELAPNDGANDDQFGESVSISGDWAFVGASRNDAGDPDPNSETGAVYIYQFDGSTWNFHSKKTGENSGDRFGEAVSVDGNFAVVGATGVNNNGAAYVYNYDGSDWNLTETLQSGSNGSVDAEGRAVDIKGNFIIVGAPLKDNTNPNVGSVYIYTYDGSSWDNVFEIQNNVSVSNFGSAVAINEEYAIIGASSENSSIGRTYIYKYNGSTWTQSQILNDANILGLSTTANFGISVDISGEYLVIGSRFDDNGGSNRGSAHVYKNVNGIWTYVQKLSASTPADNEEFGRGVSIDGCYIAVGTYRHDGDDTDTGAIDVFELNDDSWIHFQELTQNNQVGSIGFGGSVSIDKLNILGGSFFSGPPLVGTASIFTC